MPLPRIQRGLPGRDGGGSPGGKGLVLLLDDDISVLMAYARVLERAGFTVVRRSSGADVGRIVQQHEDAAANRRTLEQVGRAARVQRQLRHHFERALASLYLVNQPIVSWSRRAVFAHEALARSREPELADPTLLFAAAEELGRLHELGRAVRRAAAERLRGAAAGDCSFVNLHPLD